MKTILVPTDGSAAADKALDLALDLARQHGAALSLLHVLLRDKEPEELLRLPQFAGSGDTIASRLKDLASGPAVARTAEDVMSDRDKPDRPAPDELLRDIGARVLERALARAAERGVAATPMEIVDGAPAPAIATAAKRAGADAIVMGTRGLRQIEALAFGSVSQEVCRTAPCTCVAVH